MSWHWPRLVFLSLEWMWCAAGALCLAGAALLVWPGAAAGSRRRSFRPPRGLAGLVLGFGLPLSVCLFKLAQYRCFQLMWDSGVFGNLVWNAAHGFGLTTSVIGEQPYLVVHFTLLPYLLAPVLWLWESVQALAVVQGAVLGSCVWAAYLLARSLTEDAAAAWALAALTASSIYFHDLAGAVLDNSLYAPAFFLWGAYAFLRGRWAWAGLCAALLLATREHAPFMLAGWGVYLAAARPGRAGRPGLALAAGCAVLWLLEMRAIRGAQAAWPDPWTRWQMFSALGGAPENALGAIARRPWVMLQAMVYPPAQLAAAAKILLAFALLPLGAGAAVWPAVIALLPNQVAAAGHSFHDLGMHHSAFVLGPLAFASACALGRWCARWRPGSAGRRALLAGVLVCAGGQYFRNAAFLLPPQVLPLRWAVSVPRALACIERDSAVWADDFLLAHVGMRRHVKSLPLRLPDRMFESGLFMPDRILMSLYWARRVDAATRDGVFGFIARNGFRAVFQDADLVVWAKPEGARSGLLDGGLSGRR